VVAHVNACTKRALALAGEDDEARLAIGAGLAQRCR
jgi:hypothetical protein